MGHQENFRRDFQTDAGQQLAKHLSMPERANSPEPDPTPCPVDIGMGICHRPFSHPTIGVLATSGGPRCYGAVSAVGPVWIDQGN
jgi:hypothetical protein